MTTVGIPGGDARDAYKPQFCFSQISAAYRVELYQRWSTSISKRAVLKFEVQYLSLLIISTSVTA